MASFIEKHFENVRCPKCGTAYLVKKDEKETEIAIKCSKCNTILIKGDTGIWKVSEVTGD